ncbi:MAG: LTA synthase family protein [Gemmatimonadales bacterium]
MRARLLIIATIFLFWVGFFVTARAGYLIYHQLGSRLGVDGVLRAFWAGARLDLSGAAYLSAVPLVALMLSSFRPLIRVARGIVWAWLGLAVSFACLVVAIDLEIVRHWGRRVDAAIVPYLETLPEAWASAGATPRIALLAGALVAAVGLLAALRRLLRPLTALERGAPLAVGPLALVLGVFVVVGRGGVGTWPLTVSSAYHAEDPAANLLAENALWGFFDSAYRRAYDRSNPFFTMTAAAADSAIAAAAVERGPRRPPPFGVARPNFLIVLWESASARAIGSLGGVPGITPGFDSLAATGVLFRRFYAGGDRTDMGVAAALSGFPAIPRGAMLTTPSKTTRLPSLSASLESRGYSTGFYYGGDLEFASLKAYLISTGVDRRVGKGDFPRETWNSKWGAHDSVVAERLLDDLDRQREPFLVTWLTLSSHEPFEIPGYRHPDGADWQARYFASLRYSDRIVTSLARRAAARPWWGNTVMVIIADHGRRVLPLDADSLANAPDAEYRVPMLWLGGALTARGIVVDEVASHLDLTPTLLDAVDHDGWRRFRYGRSLLREVARPWAYYGFDEGFALVTRDGALVFDERAQRATVASGTVGTFERTLGRALLQTSYQEYLDR